MPQTDNLAERLKKIRQAIANYEELLADIDDPEYVARGNGFCDSKFSEDFIEGQLETLRHERQMLEQHLSESENPNI